MQKQYEKSKNYPELGYKSFTPGKMEVNILCPRLIRIFPQSQ